MRNKEESAQRYGSKENTSTAGTDTNTQNTQWTEEGLKKFYDRKGIKNRKEIADAEFLCEVSDVLF